MANELSPELRDYLDYLKKCGLSKRKIALCTDNTRMYHDLGLYGEIAEGYMEVLANRYHVDMSGFDFDKFFPPEFEGKTAFTTALLSLLPFVDDIIKRRRRQEYLPLTLERIDRALRSKRWE